ncbi:GrpB family protein (plasmid) [Bacillus sp. 31A1R]|uniref:GrpB family protein n=1 Tax=Robertmurraya mangrovi TaxID=3098077 RepID=A0ABU5IVD4_9BACI|nr:GrpB family protein [Bacillus sp. 31A1R]MDZ5471122.1 GrpB family protein [Bacillus sp. 31A1R]
MSETKRIVEVVPYTKEWKRLYENAEIELKNVFRTTDVTFHHIGSTSVEGLSAKPIIDILAEAADINLFDKHSPELEQIGYFGKGENGIPGRRYFHKVKDGNEAHRLVHLHAFEKGNPEINRHLIFRDFLRAHPEARNEYSEVKERAAKMYRESIDDYIEAKTPIIQELEKKALIWSQGSK